MSKTVQPDWDAINRAISESIEPMPVLVGHKLWSVGGSWRRTRPFGGVRSTTGAKLYEWSPPKPRDWREPAAAMELFKRMSLPNLMKDEAGKWWCDPNHMESTEKVSSANTPEEAIVLAAYVAGNDF